MESTTETVTIIPLGMLLIMAWILGGVLAVIGSITKNRVLSTLGLIVLGAAAFISPLMFFRDAVDNIKLVMTAAFAFLGGVLVAAGAFVFPRK